MSYQTTKRHSGNKCLITKWKKSIWKCCITPWLSGKAKLWIKRSVVARDYKWGKDKQEKDFRSNSSPEWWIHVVIHLSKPREPQLQGWTLNYGLLSNRVNAASSTIKKKSTTVLWVVHSWGDCACVGQGYTGTFYSAQICCKPKTALKNKPYRKSNVLKWYTRRKSSFLFSTRPCEMWSSIQWYAVQRRTLGLLQRCTKGGAGVVHRSAGKTWVQWQRLKTSETNQKSVSTLLSLSSSLKLYQR